VQLFVIAVGLGLAGWGHLLVHDLLGAGASWRALDDRFPPVMRSTAAFAGRTLLVVGGILVLAPVFG
jgi:hypothetical protein